MQDPTVVRMIIGFDLGQDDSMDDEQCLKSSQHCKAGRRDPVVFVSLLGQPSYEVQYSMYCRLFLVLSALGCYWADVQYKVVCAAWDGDGASSRLGLSA